MKIYNNIIAGSGPIGCHIFNKIKKNSILITGETNKNIFSTTIHPKVRVELNNQTNKFADLIYSKKNNFSIYSSSEIAGLTNYWGQQFFDYKKNELWPKKIFKRYSLYKKNLEKIDNKYPSLKSKIISKNNINKLTINKFSPPVVKNVIVNKFKLKKIAKKKLISDRVVSFRKIKKNLIEVITEKKIFYCKRFILCAGPVGNALILIRSFKTIKNVKFNDDNPRLIFGLRTNKVKEIISKNYKLIDVDIRKNNKSIVYSTIFNFNPSHFNKFLQPIINLCKSFLSKLFYYGIFWVSNEYNEIKISFNNGKISISGKNMNSNLNKVNTIKNLDEVNLRVLKIWNLKFAYGFHYHNLKLNFKGKYLSLNQFIKKMKLNKNIYCFDSSIIDKIANKPPTKTYLATANYLIEKFQIK